MDIIRNIPIVLPCSVHEYCIVVSIVKSHNANLQFSKNKIHLFRWLNSVCCDFALLSPPTLVGCHAYISECLIASRLTVSHVVFLLLTIVLLRGWNLCRGSSADMPPDTMITASSLSQFVIATPTDNWSLTIHGERTVVEKSMEQ